MKYCLFFLGSLLLVACDIGSSGLSVVSKQGVSVYIYNGIDENHENTLLSIGELKEGEFVAIESILLPLIPKSSTVVSNIKCNDSYCLTNFSDQGGGLMFYKRGIDNWVPDAASINLISSEYYFLYELQDDKKLLIKGFEIPKDNEIRVEIDIYINEDGISGKSSEVEKYID